jgi:4-hydroxybutyrate CoA-transferase
MPHDPNWREKYSDRICSAEDAVSPIRPGQSVFAGTWTSTPQALCAALAARAPQLPGVTIIGALATFNWCRPEVLEHFRVVTAYTSPLDRQAARDGHVDYLPVSQYREGKLPPGLDVDAAMIPVSPPDEDGWCSLGLATWFGPSLAASDALLIGEVHPEFVRTCGEGRIHITRFARLTEYTAQPSPVVVPPRSAETELAAQIICTLIASEIVYDGATLQFGIGDVSAALPVFLDERRELGVHTELLPGGVADLVMKGVVTGKHKAVHPGKVVAAAAAQLRPDEVEFIADNPTFEFYDFSHTDDLRLLLQLENFIAVNNALAVDIQGNAASETMGAQIFSGTGGQNVFAVGASTAAGGSVIVLPSSQLLASGERVPRIVAGHPEGTVSTVHRGYVDFVVTEQGIAKLRGKTLRQRAEELCSVSHPDLRGELKKEVRRIHGMTI